jgi:hypothetical protein
MKAHLYLLFCVVLLSLCLAGCKDKDEAKAILPSLDAAFPNSYILKIDPRLLWVQTQVAGISATTAEQLYVAACQKATKPIMKNLTINIQEELNIDRRKYLLVGFKNFYIGWDVRNGVDSRGLPIGVQVMNAAHVKDWLESRLGYYPTKDQILVERLQDVQNTPDGQPMQLPTLAALQKERLEVMQQEIAKEEAELGMSNEQ